MDDDTNDEVRDVLVGIGAFARRVGLSPSALCYYDDCLVPRPASVDPGTGAPGSNRGRAGTGAGPGG
ncbi:hypothetical protein [Embleya sp. NPDC001921]